MRFPLGRNGLPVATLLAVIALTGPTGAQSTQGISAPQVTFAKDIAPILQRSCQGCHRPGSMAPMPLLTYEQARPWARAIRSKVVSRAMPPWYVDRTIGVQDFKNDQSLSDREIATIAAWVDGGVPLGNPADLPPPRNFDTDRWTLPGGEPDLIVTADPYTMKANTQEQWIDTFVDFTLPEDRWVYAFEARPSKEGVPIVHHLLGSLEDGASRSDSERAGGRGFHFQYAPGKPATVYPEGVGQLIKAGTHRMRFARHFSSINRDTTDRSMVGIKFYPKGQEPPKPFIAADISVDNHDLDLPAGERNIRHDNYSRVTDNIRIFTYLPHMHVHGQRECIEFIYPDNRVETMNCVDFNFSWQLMYTYADQAQPLVPKGTIVHVISWHDNSAVNKLNPDPKNWIGYGQRSIDDMSTPLISGMKLTDEEFQQAIAEREQQRHRTARR